MPGDDPRIGALGPRLRLSRCGGGAAVCRRGDRALSRRPRAQPARRLPVRHQGHDRDQGHADAAERAAVQGLVGWPRRGVRLGPAAGRRWGRALAARGAATATGRWHLQQR